MKKQKPMKSMPKIEKETKSFITPLGDRVLVRPFKEYEEVRAGNFKIILPESVASEKSDKGKVVAVGAGKWEDGKLRPMSVKVGDTVIFSKYGYDEVKLNDEDLYLLKEDSLLAIINNHSK